MGALREADPALRRVQRDCAIMTVVAAAFALAIQSGRLQGALGVVAGAGLVAFSYFTIKGGVSALLDRAGATGRGEPGERASRGRVAWTVVTFIGRYLVVGIAAWVVLVPLRAHPLGLFAGVTIPVLAIGIEAVRLARGTPRRGGGARP